MEQTDNDKEWRGIMVERNSWRTRMGKAVADGLVVTHFHADNWGKNNWGARQTT